MGGGPGKLGSIIMNINLSIDVLRGLIMIIMVLDHVRDLLHVNSLNQSPTDLATTTSLLFFTRWVTYLCAPTFVFLAGTSAYLSLKSKNDLPSSRALLFKRGLSLLVLEFTLVSFGMWFDLKFGFIIFEVIAAIGTSFILLALLMPLPSRVIGIIGAVIFIMLCFINFLPAPNASFSQNIWSALFVIYHPAIKLQHC